MNLIPIISGKFIIQKMNMKGGWSFILLPPVHSKSGLPFGWFIVKGTIDSVKIEQFKLWPTADNHLFLPLNKQLRTKLRKQEGDMVEVDLFEDLSPVLIPDEFALCLLESPLAKNHFEKLSETSKKQYVDYVYKTKSLETRSRRMAVVIEKLEKGLKYHQK